MVLYASRPATKLQSWYIRSDLDPIVNFVELSTKIASLEAGRRNPSLDFMARLAKALGIDLGELVKGLQAKKGRSS